MYSSFIPQSFIDFLDYLFNILPMGGDRYVYFKFILFLAFFAFLQFILPKVPPFNGSVGGASH